MSSTAHSTPPEPQSKMGGAGRGLAAFSVPAYRRYTYGFIFSSLAMQSQVVVRGWVAFDLTGSTLDLGFVLVATGIAQLLFSPIGGVLADRWDRKKIIVSMQSVSAASALIIGILVLTDAIQLWHLLLAGFGLGMTSSIHMPARQAFIYDLVGPRHLANAVALNAGLMNVMRLVAPAIAGLVIGFVGAEIVYFYIAGSAIAAVSLLGMIVPSSSSPHMAEARKEPPLTAMVEGMRYVRRRPIMLWLVLTALAGTGAGLAFRDMLPAYAELALDLSPQGFGFLMTAAGLGAVSGSVALAYLSGSQRRGGMFLASGVAWGVLMTFMAAAPNFGAAFAVLFLLGIISASFTTFASILIQANVDDAFRGRITSLYMMTFSVHTFGALPIGLLADEFGIRAALLWSGIALIGLMAVIGTRRSDIRRLA